MFRDIENVGAEFRHFRQKMCRVSVPELSRLTGVCATQIYKFERGQSDIKLKTLVKLVKALGHELAVAL